MAVLQILESRLRAGQAGAEVQYMGQLRANNDGTSMGRRLLVGITAALLLCVAHATARAAADSRVERAQSFLFSLERPGEPGCVVGVAEKGAWVFKGAYGLANIDSKLPNSPELAFGVASITKQFTAAATAIAAFQGYFSLDDDIRKYLPEIPDYGIPITIRQLVYHTDGLRDHGRLVELTGRPHDYDTLKSRVQLLARQRAINFLPGSEYRYGNTGYLFLAEIIERTTGRSLAKFAQDNILGPLDMKHTYFIADRSDTKGRAIPYSLESGAWRSTDADSHVPAEVGSAGLVTTLDDYNKWATNLFAAESKIAGGAELTRMLRAPGHLSDGAPIAYGFGLGLDPYRGFDLVSHGGSGLGYKALGMMFPKPALGVFGFCNNGLYAHPVVMAVADIFLGLPPQDSAKASASGISVLPAQLAAFTGTYREPALRLPMIVKPSGNALLVEGDAIPYVFEPISPNRFRNNENIVIEFESAGRYLRQIQGREYGTGRFERIKVVSPTPRQLRQYAADYYSPELDATYRFSIEDEHLRARILASEGHSNPFEFQPMLRDEFVSIPDRLAIRFVRGADGQVTGLELTHQFGWIANVKLERVK